MGILNNVGLILLLERFLFDWVTWLSSLFDCLLFYLLPVSLLNLAVIYIVFRSLEHQPFTMFPTGLRIKLLKTFFSKKNKNMCSLSFCHQNASAPHHKNNWKSTFIWCHKYERNTGHEPSLKIVLTRWHGGDTTNNHIYTCGQIMSLHQPTYK